MDKPAIIDVIQADHTHRATVYDSVALERYCSSLVESGKPFKIGAIVSYGSLDLIKLSHALNRISSYGTYSRDNF